MLFRSFCVFGLALLAASASPVQAQPSADAPPIAVLFIVDCSASTAKADVPPARNRSAAIRAEVEYAIGRLDPKTFIGLMAFGHRAGFDKLGAIRYRGPAVEGLRPSADVELLVPIRPEKTPFADHSALILDDLKQLAPWGVSPVNLALRQGIDAFKDVPPELPRQIVLITDGVNAPGDNTVGVPLRDVDEFHARGTNKGIRIDVIGLKLAAPDLLPADRPDVDALKALAEKSGGTLVPVPDADGLRVRLSRVLGLPVPDAEPAKTPATIVRVGTGTIVGVVKYRDRPAEGIKITVRGSGKTVKTDAQGKFELTDLPLKPGVLQADGAIQNVTRTAIVENITPAAKGEKPTAIEVTLE